MALPGKLRSHVQLGTESLRWGLPDPETLRAIAPKRRQISLCFGLRRVYTVFMYLLGFFNNLFQGADGIILLIIVLLLFGAKRLPELARGLGSAINEFNKAKDDVHRQITQAAEPTPVAPAAPVAVEPQHPAQEQPPKA